MSKKNGKSNGNGKNGHHAPEPKPVDAIPVPVRIESEFERMSGISETKILQNIARIAEGDSDMLDGLKAIARGDLSKLLNENGHFDPKNIFELGPLLSQIVFHDITGNIKSVRLHSALQARKIVTDAALQANKILAELAGLKPAEKHDHDHTFRYDESVKESAERIAARHGKPVQEVERELRKRSRLRLVS